MLAAFCLWTPSALAQLTLTGSVLFTESPGPPPGGVALPGSPTENETIHYWFSILSTFSNPCFAAAPAGPWTSTIDTGTYTITVDFDESQADYSPICPAVLDPVSHVRIDLDPLPAGEWRLEIDSIYDGPIPIYAVVPAQTIPFTVRPAPPVPSMSPAALVALALGLGWLARHASSKRPASS